MPELTAVDSLTPIEILEDITGKINEKYHVEFSQNQVNKLALAIEENKISKDGVELLLTEVGQKYHERGLNWKDKDEPTKSGVVSSLKDKNNITAAYIVERTNKESGDKFYIAKEIQLTKEEGKVNHVDMFMSSKLEMLKNSVPKAYLSRMCNKISKEVSVTDNAKRINKDEKCVGDKGINI